MGLIKELETLGRTVSMLTDEQAKRIVSIVNEKMKEILDPHIIDVLRRVNIRGGIALEPFFSFNKTKRDEPSPFELPRRADEEMGLWDWVFENRKPVWLENIHSLDLKAPTRNLAAGGMIEPKYLNIYPETSSFMAAPLISGHTIIGVYSVESAESDRFTPLTLELLTRLSKPLARILRYSDELTRKLDLIDSAIYGLGKTSIESELTEHAGQWRTGFVARPFGRKHNVVEECIGSFMESNDIRARHFKYKPGGGYVLDEILASIRSSHFCIIDVTACNPNVFLELGVMIALGKKFLLLRRSDDTTPLPFDLKPYNLYLYRVQQKTIRVFQPATDRYEPVEGVLKDFIGQLDTDQRFRSARKWTRR